MSHRDFKIDLLKALASQIIVLHHLVLYSPMAEWIKDQIPTLFNILYWEGRYVVQIFLVIGGYLSIQSLGRFWQKHPNLEPHRLLSVVGQRFVRLGKPYWVAIALAALSSWAIQSFMESPLDTSTVSMLSVIAHALMLHDVMGMEALSAGVWYVAIDLQLFALTAFIVWLSFKLSQWTRWSEHGWCALMVLTGTVSSLLWFNLNKELENWAVYFFGSYSLGMMCHWAKLQKKRLWWSAAIVALLTVGLAIEWRERLLVAGLTALVMLVKLPAQSDWTWWLTHCPESWHRATRRIRQGIEKLGDASYAVFLIHYPIIVVLSSWALAVDSSLPGQDVAWMGLMWIVSLLAGFALHRRLS